MLIDSIAEVSFEGYEYSKPKDGEGPPEEWTKPDGRGTIYYIYMGMGVLALLLAVVISCFPDVFGLKPSLELIAGITLASLVACGMAHGMAKTVRVRHRRRY